MLAIQDLLDLSPRNGEPPNTSPLHPAFGYLSFHPGSSFRPSIR
jgi:hypothetical protein